MVEDVIQGYHGYTPQLAPVSMPTLAALGPQFPQQIPMPVGQPAVMPAQNGAFHLSPLGGTTAISRAPTQNGLQLATKSQQLNYMAQSVALGSQPNVAYQKRILSLSLTASSTSASLLSKSAMAFSKGVKRKADSRNSSPQQTDSDKLNGSVADGNGKSQPLYCKICRVVLNAPLQARQHYEGKNHTKKMKMFTDSAATAPSGDGSSSTGSGKDQATSSSGSCPSSPGSSGAPTVEINPEIYCRVCGVSFNSTKQAHQHYHGKNHAKKLRLDNKRRPGGSNGGSLSTPGFADRPVMKMNDRSTSALKGRWTSSKDNEKPCHDLPRSCENSHHNSAVNNAAFQPSLAKKPRLDFSMYRTPSGKYYCSACNMTLNSDVQFAQHVESKKHKSGGKSSSSQQNLDGDASSTTSSS